MIPEGFVHLNVVVAVPRNFRNGMITSARHLAEALGGDLLTVIVEPDDLEMECRDRHPSNQPPRHLKVVD